jgi:hypothetical protein
MHPGPPPAQLETSTDMEEALISLHAINKKQDIIETKNNTIARKPGSLEI